MRRGPANRSFTALAGISVLVTAYALCGMVGYVLVPLITGTADVTRVISGTSLLAALPFLVIVTASILMGARKFLAQAHSARTLVRRINSRRLPGSAALQALACEAGLSGRLVLLEAADRFSFTYGLLSPQVAVSTGMLDHTTSEEIRAVLEHERYHVHNLDPLKSVLAHTASAALFLLPAVGGLRKRYMVERELAADEHAARVCGRAALASALLKTLARPAPHTPTAAVGLGEPDALNARIAHHGSAARRSSTRCSPWSASPRSRSRSAPRSAPSPGLPPHTTPSPPPSLPPACSTVCTGSRRLAAQACWHTHGSHGAPDALSARKPSQRLRDDITRLDEWPRSAPARGLGSGAETPGHAPGAYREGAGRYGSRRAHDQGSLLDSSDFEPNGVFLECSDGRVGRSQAGKAAEDGIGGGWRCHHRQVLRHHRRAPARRRCPRRGMQL
jgi:Zn-dependent protease with chaperone function